MSTHPTFPSTILPLPARHQPTSIPALRTFLESPDSPFVQATSEGSGARVEDVVRRWLVPVLEKIVVTRDGAWAVVRDDWWRVRGGRGKEVVRFWALATYFTGEIEARTHPIDVVRLADDTIRSINELDVMIPGVLVKTGDLAKGLIKAAKIHGIVPHMLQPLWVLLHKARPSPGCLTPIHSVFIEACLVTRSLDVAAVVLDSEITDLSSCPLGYTDYLGYHYLGGQVFVGLQRWERAREMFRIVICAPGTSVSAIQIDAHKKFVLVNLILEGTEPTYPRFIPNQLLSAFTTHAPEYSDLARAYSGLDEQRLQAVLQKTDVFQRDGNYGLLLALYESIPARKILKMRETYVRMTLDTLAERISGCFGEVSTDEAESLVFQLVKRGDLFATITHPAEGLATVEFTDDPEPYNSGATVDKLGTATMEMQKMGAVLGGMEQALSLHEAWLKEVIRRDDKRAGEVGIGIKVLEPTVVRGVGSNWADAGF